MWGEGLAGTTQGIESLEEITIGDCFPRKPGLTALLRGSLIGPVWRTELSGLVGKYPRNLIITNSNLYCECFIRQTAALHCVPEWRVASILSETNQDHCLIKWQFTKDPAIREGGKIHGSSRAIPDLPETTVNLKGSRCIPFHSDRDRNSH
ncbi:hypothetical protein CDAR_516311 [Caerostris darwini]|uniref:Uncharacterized protein n=1 Tax=Caerostris darwini TaxID=1538125 RepID=A0AAV4WYS5_9ARAC|nr:hypothetical protein CDAR_516311 [Caerostris darwini]